MVFLSNQRESVDSKRKSQDVAPEMLTEESMSDIRIDQVAKNTILNALPLTIAVDQMVKNTILNAMPLTFAVDQEAKDTIFNAMTRRSEESGFSDTDLKELSNPREEPSPDP